MRLPVIALLAASIAIHAEPPPKPSEWNGYEKQDFEVAGHQSVYEVVSATYGPVTNSTGTPSGSNA